MEWQFDFCGDHLALDFANTVSERESGAPIERLGAYRDLVAFARQAGLIGPPRARELLRSAATRPRQAERAHGGAVRLRDALYGMFVAVARAAPPSPARVAVLDEEMWRLSLDDDLSLTWRRDAGGLDDFLGAVVLAAVNLAALERERVRVRVCEAPDCEWLFYDASRNRSRRWCDMRQCGNRMKARRHYARGKGGKGGKGGDGTGQKV